MPRETQTLRSISWRDICPWLLLVRAFSLAVSPSVLLLGMAAVAVLPLGWRVGSGLFLDEEDRGLGRVRILREHWESMPGATPAIRRATPDLDSPLEEALSPLRSAVSAVVFVPEAIAHYLTDFRARPLAYVLFGAMWTLLVASWLGGAISRKAVVWLGRDESVGLASALGHARRNLFAYFLAPLYPLIVVGFIALGCAVLGLMMRVPVLDVLAALLWVFALLAAAVGAVLIVGLAAGWPLMWGAISAEQDGEAFEALSRSYSYVFGRPLNLLFYALVAALLGALGLVVVDLLVDTTVALANSAANWGSDGRLLAMVGGEDDLLAKIAGAIISALNHVVLTIRGGYLYGYFFAAAAGVYLLLRSDVDHTELDEVFTDEVDQRFALPSLELDAAGAVAVKQPSGTESTPDAGGKQAEKADDEAP